MKQLIFFKNFTDIVAGMVNISLSILPTKWSSAVVKTHSLSKKGHRSNSHTFGHQFPTVVTNPNRSIPHAPIRIALSFGIVIGLVFFARDGEVSLDTRMGGKDLSLKKIWVVTYPETIVTGQCTRRTF